MRVDIFTYPCGLSTPTLDKITVKFLFRSTISTPGPHLMCCDTFKIYLGTPMGQCKYLWIQIVMFLGDIEQKYKLLVLVKNKYVHC